MTERVRCGECDLVAFARDRIISYGIGMLHSGGMDIRGALISHFHAEKEAASR